MDADTSNPLELAAYVERERHEMVEDTLEHLKRVHAQLAPLGLFEAWCRAAGIDPITGQRTSRVPRPNVKRRDTHMPRAKKNATNEPKAPRKSSAAPLPHILELRLDRELTQGKLAEAAGVSMATVQKAERGENISALNTAKLAKVLGVSRDELRGQRKSA